MRFSTEYYLNNAVSNKLFGSPNDFTFRQRFFLFACLLAIIYLYVSAIGDYYMGFKFVISIVDLIGGLIISTVYIIFRYYNFRKVINPVVFLITTNSVLSVNWFYCNGMNGSIPVLLLTTFAYIFFLFEEKMKVYMVIYLAVNAIALHWLEYTNPHWVVAYNSPEQSLADHLVTFAMSIPLIAIAILYAQRLYENEKLSNEKLIEQYRESSQYLRQQANNRLLDLTDRERAVLQKIAEGKTNKEIADELSVELGTVKSHINNIYKKLDVRSRNELRKFKEI